jgi:hypothetical protein
MVMREESIVEQLEHNRSTFFILKLEWEVEDAQRLADAIGRNNTVRYVFLYDHFLSGCSMSERRDVLRAVACLKKLESLVYVSNSTRVKVPVNALATILRSSKKLTTFELHGPSLLGSSSDFAGFCQALAMLPALKSFKLLPAYFERGAVDLDQLLDALSKVPTLEELRLCLYCDKSSHLSCLPLQNLCRSKVLQIFDVRWPHLCDDHLTAMCKELRSNVTLREFRVGGNSLAYSCFSVAEMIELNEGIEHLCLACRGLGNSECCKALWESIETNSFLREITFENTDVTCNRAQDNSALMGHVLHENMTLKGLRLYNMGLDNATCDAIAKALLANRTLRFLDIRKGNRSIGKDGFEALANMLQSNYTLHDLQTNCTGPLKQKMDMCLRLNQSAKKLEEMMGGSLQKQKAANSRAIFACGCRG